MFLYLWKINFALYEGPCDLYKRLTLKVMVCIYVLSHRSWTETSFCIISCAW